MPMSKNSTFFFIYDSFENVQVLCQPEKIEKEFEDVFASLPLYSPSEKSVERLMKLLDDEN